jgi:hypothetical protein
VSHYLIRVEGLLSTELTSAFPALDATTQEQTVLHGKIVDQDALAGVLARLRSLGVDVVEVHRVPDRAERA